MNEQFYVVKYSMGNFDTYRQDNAFITSDKDKAELWVNKFNRIREYWSKYYNELTPEDSDYTTHICNRAYTIDDYGTAWFDKIERR